MDRRTCRKAQHCCWSVSIATMPVCTSVPRTTASGNRSTSTSMSRFCVSIAHIRFLLMLLRTGEEPFPFLSNPLTPSIISPSIPGQLYSAMMLFTLEMVPVTSRNSPKQQGPRQQQQPGVPGVVLALRFSAAYGRQLHSCVLFASLFSFTPNPHPLSLSPSIQQGRTCCCGVGGPRCLRRLI